MPGEQELLDRILNILKFKPKGMTITEISHVTSIHRNSIAKYLQVLLASGKVDVQLVGNAKVYTTSRRLPITSMLQCSTDLIILLNEERKIIQVNDKYLEFFGLDGKDLLNRNIYETNIPVISEESLFPLINGSIEDGERQSKEITYRYNNCSYYFFVKYIPSVLDGGEHGLIVIITDFTEEKMIRDALIEHEEKFKILFNNANDSIFLYEITDDQHIGALIEVNDTACNKLNYSREEFFQRKFNEIFRSECHTQNCIIETDLAENYHSIYEGIQAKKDGTTFPVEASAHVFSLQDRLVVLYVMRDISERKLAENRLKLSENRYRNIVEGQQELICRISPDYSINYVNEAFCRHFNIQKETCNGNKFESLDICPEDKESIQKCLNQTGVEKETINIEFRIQKQGNKLIWIESSISPIFNSDRSIHEYQLVGRDVTEARQAKEALKYNEENTRFLLNSTNDNSLLIDLEGYILSLNKSSCKYIQTFCNDDSLTVKSIIGKNIYEFIPEDVALKIKEIASEISISRNSDSFVDEINTRIFDFSLSPIVNSEGEVEKIAVVKRDITERKEYESNLTDTISRLTDIFDFLPEATFVINNNSCVISWNKAMEQLTGIPKEKIIGTGNNSYSIPFYGKKHPMLIDYVIASDMSQFNPPDTIWKERDSLNAEVWSSHINNQKGAHLWVKATGLYDTEGNVIGAIESIQDVTYRKKTEYNLVKSEEKYRDLLEKTCAIVLKTDIAGNISYINEYGETLLGYQKGELNGKNVKNIIYSDSKENIHKFDSIIEGMIHYQTPVKNTEIQYTDPEGTIKWISWTNSPVIDAQGHLTGISAFGTDITMQKESDTKVKRYIKYLEFISQSSMNFAIIPHNEKIYNYISSELISLLPGGVAVVNSYEEESDSLLIKSIKGEIDGYENMLSSMLNEKVCDKKFKIPDYYRQNLSSNHLIHLSGGLFDLFLKNYSEDVCKTINDVLDIYECYMIGISRNDKLFGSISFAIPHRINTDTRSIIEIFVNQASVALQRCWYEEKMRKYHPISNGKDIKEPTESDKSQQDLRQIFENIKNRHIFDVQKQNEAFETVCKTYQNCPVFSVDKNGIITRANSTIHEIIGDTAPIIGRDISTLISSTSHHNTKDILEHALIDSTDERHEILVPVESRMGEPIEITWNLEKIYDYSGGIENILWIGDEYSGNA